MYITCRIKNRVLVSATTITKAALVYVFVNTITITYTVCMRKHKTTTFNALSFSSDELLQNKLLEYTLNVFLVVLLFLLTTNSLYSILEMPKKSYTKNTKSKHYKQQS